MGKLFVERLGPLVEIVSSGKGRQAISLGGRQQAAMGHDQSSFFKYGYTSLR